MQAVCIITEANETVATGHLSEARALAAMLTGEGREVIFYINADCPQKLLDGIPCPFIAYNRLDDDIESMAAKLKASDCSVAVTDLRRIGNEIVLRLKAAVQKVVCIDELGGRRLDCDIIINPLIASSYHNYCDSRAELHAGPGYMIVKPEFVRLNKSDKEIRPRIETVTICMGGMDSPAATIKVLRAIKDFNFRINVIVGGGFSHFDALYGITQNTGITVLENIGNVYDVLFSSDIAFCSGGNVLYELACVGTPALTVYTNPHERASAEAFAEKGFGRCLGQANEITESDILSGLDFYKSADTRKAVSRDGKRLVDGLALERIAALL